MSSEAANNLNWLINRFTDSVPAATHALVVSSDGLPLAVSENVERDTADRLAAVSSGLIGLAYGSAGRFGAGAVRNVIIEMEQGWLFVTGIRDGSLMCVITNADPDIGMVAYEMAVFADRAGEVLTPELRSELKSLMVG